MNVKDIEEYENYVCPRCFNSPYKCVCDSFGKPQYLIRIDKSMQKHVKMLNDKGYVTVGCCESHNKYMNMHIGFNMDYGFGKDIAIPDGFVIMKRPFAVSYSYDYKISDEEFENKKIEMLDVLWEWCCSLPDLTS